MNREIAMKWVADLRTPGLKQAKSALFDGEGYCCLGRLCVVLGMQAARRGDLWEFDGQNGLLPHSAVQAAELLNEDGSRIDGSAISFGDLLEYKALCEANDDGVTFAQIADWIEQNWRML